MATCHLGRPKLQINELITCFYFRLMPTEKKEKEKDIASTVKKENRNIK